MLNRKRINFRSPARQRGVSAVEYLIGLVAFLIVILTPISNGKNVVELLVDAVKKEHAAYIYAASLPRLP